MVRTLCLGGIMGYLFATLISNQSLVMQRQLEEKEESEDEDHNVLTMNITVTCIVLMLIFLTVVFEEGKEYIEEHVADRSTKPIIASLFGEMTVLGFLSAFSFCLVKLDVWEPLSERLFGEGEQLFETFELIHYMLFLVMVFFVVNVLTLVKGAEATEGMLWAVNNACTNEKYMKKLYETKTVTAIPSFWIAHLWSSFFPDRDRFYSDLLVFDQLRQEFILERSVTPPFAPIEAEKQVPLNFQFGRYLSSCLGHTLGHVVELHYWTWLFLALVTCFFMVLGTVINNKEVFPWVWAASGWALFLIGNYFDYHILRIVKNMLPSDSSLFSNNSESGSLLLSSEVLPAWTNIHLPEELNHNNKNRQDTLYWMGRKGPHAYTVAFQIRLVFTSTYLTLLALVFFPSILLKPDYYSLPVKILFVITSLLPILLQWMTFRRSAYHLALVCSIGVHRKPQAIAQVIRMMKTDQLIRSMVTMQKLQNLATGDFTVRESVDRKARAQVEDAMKASYRSLNKIKRSLSFQQLSEVSQMFDAIDSDGDGHMDASEIADLLRSLGQPTTPESITAMIHVLDDNGDGVIQKDEFITFYATHCVMDKFTDERDLKNYLKTLARDLFTQFDLDRSGELSLSEFKSVMDAFNVGFTVDEIGQLVNELDQHHADGLIVEHEFFCLLETHRHLFTNTPLPPL